MNKLTFSGHEKFHCRQFWLKKGYDFVQQKGRFSDENAVVALGVGKNMVNSIRYWLKAFDLVDQQEQPNALAREIFGANGKDPYLEHIGTIWLLHYYLVAYGPASIYGLFFNQFRKERIEFTKAQFLHFLKRTCEAQNLAISENSLSNDIDILIKNYLRPKRSTQNIEDDFSGLLIDLDLLQEFSSGGTTWYKVENSERDDLPVEMVLYAILDQEAGNVSISFDKLLNAENGVGLVYALSANGLMRKIREITAKFSDIIFSDDAGIRELQFKQEFQKEELLRLYYAN
ncbi:hypothetical protein U27_06209 [Candidatus Vecturithrix granuli]|uniref:DUF4007 domain-containing protein n=1 Tax=Vecturithrix granuli TaxID=1499967 RepID=A0A081C3S7_VECG1|nr:hypothetical protein U27_06209 [Candidatus Vecturithrix granuli]